MAYKLTLGMSDGKLFEIVYEGFMRTARPSTREEHRATNAILDILEGVSTPDINGTVVPGYDPADPLSPKMRHLNPGGGYGVFDDAHYKYLKEAIDKLSGPAPMSRLIVQAQEWIDKGKQGDAKSLVEEAG